MLYENHLKVKLPLNLLSIEKRNSFQSEVNCSICGYLFNDKSNNVLDHSHLTGEYRGAVHNDCNINNQLPNFFPIFFS